MEPRRAYTKIFSVHRGRINTCFSKGTSQESVVRIHLILTVHSVGLMYFRKFDKDTYSYSVISRGNTIPSHSPSDFSFRDSFNYPICIIPSTQFIFFILATRSHLLSKKYDYIAQQYKLHTLMKTCDNTTISWHPVNIL